MEGAGVHNLQCSVMCTFVQYDMVLYHWRSLFLTKMHYLIKIMGPLDELVTTERGRMGDYSKELNSVVHGVDLSFATFLSKQLGHPGLRAQRTHHLLWNGCHFHKHLLVAVWFACVEASLSGSYSLIPVAALLPCCWQQEQTDKKNTLAWKKHQVFDFSLCFLLIILMRPLPLCGLLTVGSLIHLFIISEYPRWAKEPCIFHFRFLFLPVWGRLPSAYQSRL